MTDDEMLDWARAHKWRLDSYYKYQFTLRARDKDGTRGALVVGGDSGDIYAHRVYGSGNHFDDLVNGVSAWLVIKLPDGTGSAWEQD